VGKGLRVVQVALYVGVVVLLNLAAARFFAQADLTSNRVHSLSPASIDAVQTLREPLTIHAFFSRDLPVPYNNVAQQVEDLLQAYSLHAGAEFNYEFHWIDGSGDDDSSTSDAEVARQYLISPVQIREVEQDEVKVTRAFMGVALLHGDLMERIGALTSADQLELRMTDRILSLSQQISALVALEQGMRVDLIVSSRLTGSDREMRALAQQLPSVVARVGERLYDRIELRELDPDTDPAARRVAAESSLSSIRLNASDGTVVDAYAGLAVHIGEATFALDLVFGGSLGLQLMDPDAVETALLNVIAGALGAQRELGYVVDFEAPPYRGRSAQSTSPETVEPNLANFFELVSPDYDLRGLLLRSVGMPPSLETVLVVAPQEPLSEWALFQLDQFLMRGNSLVVFQDPLDIFIPGGATRPTGATVYSPRRTGLEAMLAHYGVELPPFLVMDEQSFVLREQDPASGEAVELILPFAPTIGRDNMDTSHPVLAGIDSLQMLNVAPLGLTDSLPEEVRAHELFRSSAGAWVLRDVIDPIDPQFSARPPGWTPRSFPLAYLLEGRFTSYFFDRPLPEAPPGVNLGAVDFSSSFLPIGASGGAGVGRLVVVGSSAILGNNILGSDVASPNARFVLNLLDHLSGRGYRAEMRIKGQSYRRLPAIDGTVRGRIKTWNMVGPPLFAAVAGAAVWLLQRGRRQRIRRRFEAAQHSG
jgi:ABC-2 type transport system permease protein